METLLIQIFLNNNIETSHLEFRQIIVGTLEERDLGEVVEETSSINMLEIVVEVKKVKEIKEAIKDIIMALGFTKFNITKITI